MSLKVFQLAKELGVDSKAIVKKCQDEGIPKIDTHMSPVSAGLAATIREWFNTGELKTAIETTAHVDVAKVRKPPRSRSKGRKGEGDEDGATTAVAEPPAGEELPGESLMPTIERETVEHGRIESPDATPVGHELVAPVQEPVQEETLPVAEEAPVAEVPVVETPEAPEAPIIEEAPPVAPSAAPAPTPAHPPASTPVATPVVESPEAPPIAPPVAPVKPVEIPVNPRDLRPAATAGTVSPPHGSGSAPTTPTKPVAPAKPVKEIPQKPIRPAVMPVGVMNVPKRPDIVKPMGQIVVPKKAELRGPQVVRMEQPDNLPAPRPRPAQSQRPNGPVMGGPSRPAGAPGSVPPAMPGTPSHARSKGKGGAAPVDDEEGSGLRKPLKGRSARRHGGRSADAGIDAIREWREADLVEREERMQTSGGLLRERKREMSKTQQRAAAAAAAGNAPRSNHIEITPPVTIRELSEAMGIKGTDLVKKLMQQGVMATVNQTLDIETAQMLALEFGMELTVKARESEAVVLEREYKVKEETATATLRPPVVTILGHVDHGKTSLLDKIRSANVAAGEAGGITQHVGAYTVTIAGSDGKEKRVTFLDTPGHQAFTAMRARGANMTDVVVLVVAADDGVMPQTIESINHAKAANVPIVVAMNKIDKPEANANKVLGQLAEHGLNPTEWGGDVEVVRTSAVSGQGVKELIEYLDYTAMLRDLKASPELPARGSVVEAFMDPNRGVIARVLVQNGTLRVGDILVCGPGAGRVRSLVDDKNKPIKEAGPATPVEVIGLDEVPAAGDKFYAVDDIDRAKSIAEERLATDRAGEIAQRNKVTLENLYDTIKEGDIKELRVILKADVQGSVDVLKQLLTEELSKEVKVRLLHAAVGGITESDVLLAEASDAIIIGFSVVPDEVARKMAEDQSVEIRTYRIIYEITDDIRKALTGMLSPTKQDQVLGHAEIRQVIKVSRVGNIAGCMVSDGVLQRNAKYRLIREGTVVTENLTLDSLKRFKEDVKEVRGGLECGIKLAGYDDIKIGDRVEAYKTVDVARTL